MEVEPVSYFDTLYDLSSLEYGNETLDYTNIPYFGEIKKMPLYEVILKSYLYAMIIFFSLVGNTLIIVVVLRHKQMRTTTNFYIVNLAVADILVTIFCTWVHLVNNLNNNNWVLGRFFCKFNTFSQVLCLVASVLSLTLIAYDRFFGIVFALKAHMSRRKARFSIAVIWICSFAIAAPLLWFRELKERQWQDYTERWCDDSWPIETRTIPGSNFTVNYMPSRTIYFTFVSAVLYFFPMLVMALAYSIIIRKLRSSTMPGERVDAGYAAQQKTKRKVVTMLVTIMVVFGVCWLPYQIVLLYSELRENRDRLEEWYFTMQFLAGCFAYSNSAVNPLIYAGFNKNFKEGAQEEQIRMYRTQLFNPCQRRMGILLALFVRMFPLSEGVLWLYFLALLFCLPLYIISALLNMRYSWDTLPDYNRRQSLQYTSVTYRRRSTEPFLKTGYPHLKLTAVGNRKNPQRNRRSSLESASPLLSNATVSSLVATPSPEILSTIRKYRREAEKYAMTKEKLSPQHNLIRTYTQKPARKEIGGTLEFDTPPMRRHSDNSYFCRAECADDLERTCGE